MQVVAALVAAWREVERVTDDDDDVLDDVDGHRDEVAEDGEVADDAVRIRSLTFFSGESIDRCSLNRVVTVSDGLLLLTVLP